MPQLHRAMNEFTNIFAHAPFPCSWTLFLEKQRRVPYLIPYIKGFKYENTI